MSTMLLGSLAAIGALGFCMAQEAPPISLPAWSTPSGAAAERFEFAASPEQVQSGSWRVAGVPRKYFAEVLPALFERTLVVERADFRQGGLEWIFTGESGGFTVEVDAGKVRVSQRYYDSFGLGGPSRTVRHPERTVQESAAAYAGDLRAITVRLDSGLGLSVLLNGREAIRQKCLLDASRHQLAWSGSNGGAGGYLLATPAAEATVVVDASRRHQTMLGFGGITTPTAYAALSPYGKRRWWQVLAEYNLLLHREYPIGARLNPEMDNWDHMADAVPHYYGDNFPNGEISDFTYMKNIRRLGGKVLFEFWALPPWARKDWVDSQGKKYAGAADPEPWARAVVRYCQVSRERTGAPPDIVGIQNEVAQPAPIWHAMATRLRAELDKAGFQSVRIHMRDDGRLRGGIQCARDFRQSPAAWKSLDYTATHMYDYQDFLYNPDGYDALLAEWREAAAGKPFLSTELSINNNNFQTNSYRLALGMGQLYHKNLALAGASALIYCWLLLNVEQPSYGWTRALFVPDPARGFVPKASSYQARVFGAYSRRVRAGMVRVEARASNPDLLVTAFAGQDGTRTLVILNRSLEPQRVRIDWPGRSFRYQELVSPYLENAVSPAQPPAGLLVDPGAIATISTEDLGRLSRGPNSP